MRRRSLLKGVLAVVLALQGKSAATALAADDVSPPAAAREPGSPIKPPPKKSDGLISIDFYEPTEIRVVAGEVARWTGKNIIIDEQVRGKIQIIAPKRVTKDEAYQAFLSSLNMLGLTTIETGRVVKIVRISEGMKANPRTYTQAPGADKRDEVITQVLTLKYINAQRLRSILSRFVTSNAMVAHAETNTLIISDSAYNVQRVLSIIELMDVKTQQPRLLMIPVVHSTAKDIAEKIREYIKLGGSGARVSHYHNYEVAIDERSNSLLLLGPPGGLRIFRDFVKKLDIPERSATADLNIHVRPLEYAEAKKMAVTLAAVSAPVRNQMAGRGEEKQNGLKITADEDTNSLIISGSRGAFRATNRVIRQLDIRKAQVFLEADILEINSGHTFTMGTSVLGGFGNRDGTGSKMITAWQAGAMAPIVVAGSQAGQAAASSVQAKEVAASLGEGMTLGVFAPQGVDVAGLGRVTPGALLKLIKADSDTRILSSPYILTVDNEEASISVGETVFFKSLSPDAQGGVVPKVEKENVDLSLTVKPNVGSGQSLSLKIGLEANSIAGLTSEGLPRLSKRKVTQIISLKEGQTAVVAGVKQQLEQESLQKIPLLGDIPVLGALFRTRVQQSTQSQIAVFLTPYVVRGADDMARIYQEKLRDVHHFLESVYGAETKEDDFFADLPSIEDGNYQESPGDRWEKAQQLKRRQRALMNWGYTEEGS